MTGSLGEYGGGGKTYRSDGGRKLFFIGRAELKVTDLRWRSPICGFLRFSAKICGFSAVSCALHMLEVQREVGESAKICGFLRNLRFGLSLCHLTSVPLGAPRLGSLLVRFCPPPLFLPPRWRSWSEWQSASLRSRNGTQPVMHHPGKKKFNL